jgi:hypothetical protein
MTFRPNSVRKIGDDARDVDVELRAQFEGLAGRTGLDDHRRFARVMREDLAQGADGGLAVRSSGRSARRSSSSPRSTFSKVDRRWR